MIWTSTMAPVEADDTTIGQEFESVVSARPGHLALVDGPGGAGVTYLELARRVERIAAWLHGAGLGPGGCLAFWAPNTPPVAATVLATMRLGAAATGINPAATDREVARHVGLAGASILVTVPALAERAAAVADRVVVIGEAGGAVPLTELLAGTGPAPPIAGDPDAVALLPFSSGTSGLPKGVQLTHRQVVTVCRQIARGAQIDGHDVTLALAPWFHIMGITAELLVPLTHGATVIAAARFDPGALVDQLRRTSISYLIVPPPIAQVLARDDRLGHAGLERLELIGVGGAPLRVATQRLLADRLPTCTVGQGWGLTEMSGAICVPDRCEDTRPGTVGRLLPGTELRVADPETGSLLGAGAPGELQARGPQRMLGYLGEPTATAEMITSDGWLRTGDLGYVDAQDNVVVLDRLKELIKVNAYQVAPAEIEGVLLDQPGIIDAAVVRHPDEASGETPVAYVVAGAGVSATQVRGWAAERLAPYKRPSVVHLVDRLPRTPSGKLLRRELGASR